LSYAAADRARVEPLVKAMEAHGFDVWWDRDISLGESYHRVIEKALESAACAIVIWSHNSVSSEWVTNEASEARKRGILVPALLDEVEPPSSFAICSRPACSTGGARRMTPMCSSSSVQWAGSSNVAPRRCRLRSDDGRRWELQRAGGKRQPAGQ